MKNIDREKKVIIYIVLTMSVLSILLIIGLKIYVYNKNNIPQINYDSADVSEINQEINELYSNIDEDETIDYEKYDNDKYLTYLFIMKVYNEDYDRTVTFYNSYIIDKETEEKKTNQEILAEYGYSEEDILSLISDKLYSYYLDEINNGYIDQSTCDFDCYKLEYREIEDLSYIYVLSIEENKLVIYFDLNLSPTIDDEEYFDNIKNPSRIEID